MKGCDRQATLAERDRALFDRIAEGYARKDMVAASRVARKERTLATLRLLPASSHTRILEVGCGAGFASEYLSGQYGAYVGIDPSEELIRIARKHHGAPTARFVALDAMAFHDRRGFDLIFAVGVLHHIPDWETVVRHLSQLLTPGGWLAVNEPQPSNLLVRTARRVRRRVDRSYSGDQKELSATEIADAFRVAGLRSIRCAGQGILSTPFAEVLLRPRRVAHVASCGATSFDRWLERRWPGAARGLAWNIVVAGTR